MECLDGCKFFEPCVTLSREDQGRCEIKVPQFLESVVIQTRDIWHLDENSGCDLGRPKKE